MRPSWNIAPELERGFLVVRLDQLERFREMPLERLLALSLERLGSLFEAAIQFLGRIPEHDWLQLSKLYFVIDPCFKTAPIMQIL
jgi:hypothetical protein